MSKYSLYSNKPVPQQAATQLPSTPLPALALGGQTWFFTSRVTLSTLLNHHPQGQQCLLQVVRVWHPLTVFPARRLRLGDSRQAPHHQSGAETLSMRPDLTSSSLPGGSILP